MAKWSDRAGRIGTFIALWLTAMALGAAELPPYFIGPVVTKREQLAGYTGMKAVPRICGEWRRRAYICNHEQLAVNYGDNVEFQLRREQIILTPQTAGFLYGPEGVPKPRYVHGTRPVLEAVVAKATAGLKTQQERALALMRFCRDLKKRPDRLQGRDKWYFGGTEEALIEKGEDLCETLGRLFTALCEVDGIPARIIMHDIGGHITAEAYMDGHWGYVDPRFGIYFLRPDGRVASLLELMQSPELTLGQSDAVKAEAAGAYTWEQRAESCRRTFFTPAEINGFQYYSLADAHRYNYATVTDAMSRAAGLYRVNKVYAALIGHVFNLQRHGRLGDYFWTPAPLKPLEMAWRSDGFTPWYNFQAPIAAEKLDRTQFAPFAGTAMKYLVWGTGPGSTFTHRTKAGQIFGYGVTDEEWKTLFRPGDRNVHDNIAHFLAQGIDPQALVAELAHRHGLKLFSRLEMNHTYGPVGHNWMWLAFMGEFDKRHPECRIPGSLNLDFRHQAVRDFKLAILRELATSGVDGLVVDFAVYPPYFSRPAPEIMTDFMREVRKMLDEEGARRGRRLALQVSLPWRFNENYGLDWRTWLREGLVDILVPTGTIPVEQDRYPFDVRIGEFLRERDLYGGKVYAGIDQDLRIFSSDPHPDGIRRYSRGKTGLEINAQVLMFMRAGADGVIFNNDTHNRYLRNPDYYNRIGTPEYVEFADKNYIAGPNPPMPVIAPNSAKGGRFSASFLSLLRVADDIPAARAKGLSCQATLVLNCRALAADERMEVYLNGRLVAELKGADAAEESLASAFGLPKGDIDLTVPDWWKRAMRAIPFPPDLLWMGENIIRVTYCTDAPARQKQLQVLWPEIQLRYRPLPK